MLWQNAYSALEPLMNIQGIYSWPFDPLFPVDVRFYTYNKRPNLPLNRHDYFEVLYVLQGRMTFQIHRRWFDVRAGDLLVLGSTLFHRPIEHRSPPTKAVVLYFLPEMVLGKSGSGEDTEYLMPFMAQDEKFPHLIAAETGIPLKILDLVKCIHEELPAKSIRSRLNARTYLKMLLVLLGNHYVDHHIKLKQFQRKQENIKRLRPVLEFLERQFAKPIMVGEMASMAHMSKSSFMRFFRNVTGQGFVAYINHVRIAKAEWLLAETDFTLAELCQQVGFCDQSYFGMVFRKLVGMAPGQYRHQFSGAPYDDGLKKRQFGGPRTEYIAEQKRTTLKEHEFACLKSEGELLIGRGDMV